LVLVILLEGLEIASLMVLRVVLEMLVVVLEMLVVVLEMLVVVLEKLVLVLVDEEQMVPQLHHPL
jgi:hypothetical protein